MHVSESALVRAAAAGHAGAVEELYDSYWPLAWQWALLMTGRRDAADDIAQDAILRAFGALSRFDSERPFRPWLKRIVVNCALSELRRDRRLVSGNGWLDELPPERESDDELLAALRDLSAPRRTVIVLHFWLDMSIDAIADTLGVPFGTVASRLSRGLAELRAALEARCA